MDNLKIQYFQRFTPLFSCREQSLIKENSEKVKLTLEDIEDKLGVLRYVISKDSNFETNDIPEKILDAFVEEVVVYKERFVWKLNFSEEGITCFFNENKKNPAPKMVMDSAPLECNSRTDWDSPSPALYPLSA